MRRYSDKPFTVDGVLKLSGNLGAIIEMDGGGYWLATLNRKTRKLLNHRIRATGIRVGFNDFHIREVEGVASSFESQECRAQKNGQAIRLRMRHRWY